MKTITIWIMIIIQFKQIENVKANPILYFNLQNFPKYFKFDQINNKTTNILLHLLINQQRRKKEMALHYSLFLPLNVWFNSPIQWNFWAAANYTDFCVKLDKFSYIQLWVPNVLQNNWKQICFFSCKSQEFLLKNSCKLVQKKETRK